MVTQYRLLVAILALSVLSTACASGQTSTKRHAQAPVGAVAAHHALNMVGTNYRYGGTHPRQGFDCSGLVQYSYKRAGIAVPPEDPAALAEAVTRLGADPDERRAMGLRGRELAVRRFSLARQAERLARLLASPRGGSARRSPARG